MKRLLKDKRGMSLMEILVAFTLLMILIVGTTPVMLTAYNSLYRAGEYTQDTYDAKTEIEDQLATRSSVVELQNFAVNFNNLGAVAQINAKKAVSKLVNGLETVFTGGRAYITIISGNTVNDDATSHEITVQISNYNLKSFDEICDSQNWTKTDKSKRLIFNVIIPSKSSTANSEEIVYPDEGAVNADVEVVRAKSNLELGRITIKVDGDFDFTKSPLKIQIYYYDEDENLLSTADYLHIKTPTIIAAGKTTNNDYYTTAGVVTTENKTTNTTTTTFDIEGRKMTTSNASGTMNLLGTFENDGITPEKVPFSDGAKRLLPEITTIKSVNWVTEYEFDNEGNKISPDVPYENSYYVLTGTNGAIYRTYSFNEVGDVLGLVDLDSGEPLYNGTTQKDVDVIKPNDQIFNINNGETTIYPAVWGGDFAHIYGYSAYNDKVGYKGQDTWYTEDTSVKSAGDSGVGQAGYYSNKALFAYYYHGYHTSGRYKTNYSKKISYLLTELENSLRVGGYMEDSGDYDFGHRRIWERPVVFNEDGSYSSEREKRTSKISEGYWYNRPGETIYRCTIIEDNKSDEDYQNRYLNQLPSYLCNNAWNEGSGGGADRYGDSSFAQLRLKGLTTVSPTVLGDNLSTDKGRVKYAFDVDENFSRVAVTDAIYLPATSKNSSGMFYVGTVAAYAIINQLDNNTTTANYASDIKIDGEDNEGFITSYYVMGNDSGTATTIYKYSSKNWGRDESGVDNNLTIFQNKSQAETKSIEANSNSAKKFFVTRNTGAKTCELFSDLYFTMGFASNRELVYSKIVYGENKSGAITEQMKSYESYYFLSRYDDLTDSFFPNCYLNDSAACQDPDKNVLRTDNPTDAYLNSMDNDYYNVWFPGEMYNLTNIAEKNGVAIAVGYAVSGSTYTWINPAQTTNSSTALGSIYNDGVVSGMVLGKDTSFNSLLYFKDPDLKSNVTDNNTENGFDNNYLTSNYNYYTNLKDSSGNYGTHARNSVQFTAVDLSIENIQIITEKDEQGKDKLDDNGNVIITSYSESYYAYYADNWGRVFRSLVATKDGSGNIDMVSHIADQEYTSTRPDAPSFMEEQKVGTNSIGTYFEKITSIKATSDLIIVTGHPKAGSGLYIVVGEISDGSAAPTWKAIQIDGLTNENKANDMLYLSDYLYIVGDKGTTSGGWISATAISSIKKAVETSATTITGTRKKETADALYAIDGHS